MRFNNSSAIPLSCYNGFVPPTSNVSMHTDANGQTVVYHHVENQSYDFQQDLQELHTRLQNHNWHYKFHQNLDVYNAGYHNERAILKLVERHGGIFTTIWETERSRNLVR